MAKDSFDKIVQAYFAVVASSAFEYKGKIYGGQPYVVSPGIFRRYTCSAGCGACCTSFTLDYLPSDSLPKQLAKSVITRKVEIAGKHVSLLSDMPTAHADHFCKFLDKQNGRCKIHARNPFSCDFELLRSAVMQVPPHRLTTRLYGRGWAMLRIDGERGALCTIENVTSASIADVVRKLKRLKEWTDYCGIPTKLALVIAWAQTAAQHNIPAALHVEPDHVRT